MQAERFEFTGANGKILPAVIWRPENIRAVLQVVHGTTEHMGRYGEFAALMAEHGVAVAGFDLRGHGRNPGDPKVAAFVPGDWQASVDEVQMFREYLAREFFGVPQFIMGFSLGSFLVRDLLNAFPSDSLAGVILMGTGHQPGWLLSVMRKIVAGQIRKVGFDRPSALVRKLSFGMYNDKFKPNRTEVDWLSSNEDTVDAYLADPLVHRQTSAGLFWELLGSMQRHCRPDEYDRWRKDLPVLLISGSEDPVGNAGKGVMQIGRWMNAAGMQQLTLHLIPEARHDLLHERVEQAALAKKLIADWLEDRMEHMQRTSEQ